MSFSPTPSQKLAIETKNTSLLLSAAAGSGKTATLTQRIIESITDENSPADISRMLIVTFTRAAAAELRERITKAISEALSKRPEDEHLNRQALLVGSASIYTIDAFCLDVVKSNFQRLTLEDGTPLPPDFRMADSTELSAMRLSLMESTLDDWYEKSKNGINFASFAENFTGMRDDGDLAQALLEFSERTLLYHGGESFAFNCAKNLETAAACDEFFASSSGETIKKLTRDALLYYSSLLEDGIEYLRGVPTADAKYLPAFWDDLRICREALATLESGYASVKNVLDSYAPVGLKALGKYKDDYTDFYKNLRGTAKSGLMSLRSDYYAFDPKTLSEYLTATAKNAKILGEFVNDYRHRLSHEKAIRRICDFNDVKLLAYRLLVAPDGSPTNISLSLRERYDTVYIDEYQDVDPIQDAIFAAVARENGRFMVGDIKQSIYGFRGADPSIFGNYRALFSPVGEASKHGNYIFMSENFRCNDPIIKFTNLISRSTFVPSAGAVDYGDADDLVCKKSGGSEIPVKLAFFLPRDKDAEHEDFDFERAEVRYVVNEICSLLKDQKKDSGEAILPKDIAVLTRSSSLGAEIASALESAGVPVSDAASRDYFANPEVLLILSLISTVDNPRRDIRLASALRSPLFGFSMDELVKIRRAAEPYLSLYDALCEYLEETELTAKCRNFVAVLESLQKKACELPLDRFIRGLFRDFSLTSLEIPDDSRSPEQIHDNILRFYEYARGFSEQRLGGTLGAFVKYIDDIISAGVKTETEAERSNKKVSIMTIHKSKGLEFPVVFVCGCGAKFNRNSLKKSLLYDARGGLGMQITDQTGFARIDTPIRTAVAKTIADAETEEEMRILYVALTRARERLYVTGKLEKKKYENVLADLMPNKFVCRHSVLGAKCYIDWILPAVISGGDSFELSVFAYEDIPDFKTHAEKAESLDEELDRELIDKYKEEFKKSFEFEYAHKKALALPAKLSVSRLYPTVLDDDGAASLDEKNLPELMTKPLFMLEDGEEKDRASAAERGTATHVFLQFCDFEAVEKYGVERELSRLTEENFIPSGTAELVNLRQLKSFFASRFYSSVRSAKRILREQRFNLFLSASEFSADPDLKKELIGESLLVQGVIDLVFEDQNGDITLCDYKTDYLTRDELADISLARKKLTDRHAEQLGYYAQAIKKLFGKAPARVCIYSLPLGDTVELDI